MTLAQTAQKRPSNQLEPQYVYGKHPDALASKHTLRVFVDVPGVDLVIDLLMPSDGKPLGRRIRQWCLTKYQVEYREWWTPEDKDEF